MKWPNDYRTRWLSFAFVAMLALGGGRAKADYTFGEPVNIGPPVNTAAFECSPCISADGLSLFFASDRPGGYGGGDLWMSTRATAQDDWREPVNLGPRVNGPDEEYQPALSTDGQELYFSRGGGASHSVALWVTRRAATSEPWIEPVKLDLTADTADSEGAPSLSADGLELYFCFGTWDPPGMTLAVAKRDTTDAPWGVPVSLGPVVNNWPCQVDPRISSDGLLLLFSDWWMCSPRPGGFGANDMWRTKRQTKDSDWGAPVNLGQPVNSEFYDYCGMISADGSMLYFSGNPAGAADDDLWQASVIPIVDFNGDRIVDVRDLVRLIESWGKDDPAVDIGPMPWGDGKVDRADLEVFMRYWGQEPYDATLMAHWKLDEAAGIVAADRVGANSGTLVGNPIWQPAGGKVGGALQLDGIDDSVRLPFVVDPANGLFSIFVWIKSGAPGQAILSVIGGADWLKADEILGCLMTNLPQGTTRGKTPTPLLSQSPITDGQWHRVGLVWTGKNRILYVDGIEVAQDTPSAPLLSCSSGLNLGTSSTLAPGTFWKGLIDDVRIYNRAVRP